MNKKRRSAKEVIESTPYPDKEHKFIKYSGEEPIDITDYSKVSRGHTATDWEKRKRIFDERLDTMSPKYGEIHTHPTEANFYDINFWHRMKMRLKGIGPKTFANQRNTMAIPSAGDLVGFFKGYEQSMTIAVRDSKSGEVLGYRIVKTTKRTPHIDLDTLWPFNFDPEKRKEFYGDINKYKKDCGAGLKQQDYEKVNQTFESFCKKYHLNSRLISTEDYEPSKERTTFVKKKGLEKIIGAAIIILFGIFLIYPKLTGNTIGSFDLISPNIMGGALVIIILICLLLLIKKRNS